MTAPTGAIETIRDAFNRGYESGKVNTRLDGHDAQLASMTSTLSKVVDVEARLTLAVETLAQDAKAEREKAVALAFALKEADETRRNKDSSTWLTPSRVITVVVAVVGVAAVALTYLAR